MPKGDGVVRGVPPGDDGVEGGGVVGSLPPEGLSIGLATGLVAEGVTADEGFEVNRVSTGTAGLPGEDDGFPVGEDDGFPVGEDDGFPVGEDDGFPVNGLTVDGVKVMFDERSLHVPTLSHPRSSLISCVVAPSSDVRCQTGGK
jgi:hypothetical protein